MELDGYEIRCHHHSYCQQCHNHIFSLRSSPLPLAALPSIKAHSIEGLADALLLVSDLTDQGRCAIFLKDCALIMKASGVEDLLRSHDEIEAEGVRENRTYYSDRTKTQVRGA